MANLVVFFRYAATLELRDKFDKDMQELLLAEIPNTDGRTMLSRLINFILLVNFRYVIFEILQKEIWEMAKYAHQSIAKNESFEYVILPDILRVVTHACGLSNEAKSKGVIKFNRNRRLVKF